MHQSIITKGKVQWLLFSAIAAIAMEGMSFLHWASKFIQEMYKYIGVKELCPCRL